MDCGEGEKDKEKKFTQKNAEEFAEERRKTQKKKPSASLCVKQITPLDFTFKTYRNLLTALQNQGFVFQTFAGFLENPADKAIILRRELLWQNTKNVVKAYRVSRLKNSRSIFDFRFLMIDCHPGSWKRHV